MSYIELSGKRGKDKKALVDEDIYNLYGHLSWFLGDTGYAMRRPTADDGNKITIRLHRLVMEAPENMVVDHLNGNTLDNRRNNLRICTQAENARNRHNTVGYVWDKSKNKWMVRYKGIFYGRYVTEQEAKKAYQLAKSGVPYNKKARQRFMLPKGVFYMKSQSKFGRSYYIRPQINNIRYFRGYFSTIQEAEEEYLKFMDKEK